MADQLPAQAPVDYAPAPVQNPLARGRRSSGHWAAGGDQSRPSGHLQLGQHVLVAGPEISPRPAPYSYRGRLRAGRALLPIAPQGGHAAPGAGRRHHRNGFAVTNLAEHRAPAMVLAGQPSALHSQRHQLAPFRHQRRKQERHRRHCYRHCRDIATGKSAPPHPDFHRSRAARGRISICGC